MTNKTPGKISITMFAAFLLLVPAVSALHWGVGGSVVVYPDDDHLEILVSAFTACGEFGARSAGYAADHPAGYSASAYTYGQMGAGQNNYYHKGQHTVTASSSYDGEGPKQASASAQSGSSFYWANCTYPGSHTHGGGIVFPVDGVGVVCEAKNDSGISNFKGAIATDKLGNTVLIGQRDGQDVVLPTSIDYGTAVLKTVANLSEFEVSNVQVEANFAPGVCDIQIEV